MPPVCATHGGNPRGVTGSREPVVNSSSNLATVDRWLAGAVVAGNEQHDPVAACDRLLKDAVDRVPRLVEIVTVEVEDAIGFDIARLELAVPAAVQRQTRRRSSGRSRGSSANRCFDNRALLDRVLSFGWWGWKAFAR